MMRVYAPVLILVCSLAVLAAATTYCGTEPVSYTLYEPNDRAGFVFSTNVASVTCGLATVSSGVATGISVNAFCAFFDEQGNEYAEALLQQAPTNGYTSMPFEISCPVGSRAQIAVSNAFATQSAPINVTYNFELSNAGSVSKVPFVYRHAVALAGPATVDYCGVAPVSYVLHGPGYYAGFVWPSNQITLSCGLSTTSNAYSTGIQVHAYCSFSQSAETILQQIPTNGYFSGSLLLTCPEGSSVIVATSNSLATSFVPINATYNFEATATDGSYLAKTPVFRSSK